MTSIDPTTITLDKGSHENPDDGMCLLEAVAYVQGEPFSDHPKCVSPVLGEFGRHLNDVLPDDLRQQLIPFIALLPGTAGDGLDEARGYLALDWLIRTFTPAWLELAGLGEEARGLRKLGRIVDMVSAERAAPVVRAGRDKAAAAGAAACAAAAGAAARAALSSMVEALQRSALDLLRSMITPERTQQK